MCCIFTCCGWMIDLIQRFWTFAMSCCISSAVCCALVTASMSGIAMGYNYSLAEYIDLKETNVSVYLKRGVFDDEIGDDADWRRSGHMPVEGHLRDSNRKPFVLNVKEFNDRRSIQINVEPKTESSFYNVAIHWKAINEKSERKG